MGETPGIQRVGQLLINNTLRLRDKYLPAPASFVVPVPIPSLRPDTQCAPGPGPAAEWVPASPTPAVRGGEQDKEEGLQWDCN
jgi:hypothetical protein